MADMKRVERVLSAITAENLNMHSWGSKPGSDATASCGTTMCFAGHAVVAAGKTIRWEPGTWDDRLNPETGQYEEFVTSWSASETTDGEGIEDYAQEWLGLTAGEADRIFYATGIDRDVTLLRDHVDTVLNRPLGRSLYELRRDEERYGR